MSLNERTIFLVDGIGGILTAVIVGYLLPTFMPWVGLPVRTLQVLGFVGLGCALYSWTCFMNQAQPRMLLPIILANAAYGAVTAYLCFASPGLTRLGRAYFAIEIAVLLELILMELKLYRALRATAFLRAP